jgi:single-strand DNA-binding protein
MAQGLNQCNFIGNLGRDPEVRQTQGGKTVVNMRLAVGNSWRDKNTGERQEKTEWVNIVIWAEGLAKVAEQYCKKGGMIYVSGELQTRKWQDQQGNDRYSTEVVLNNFNGKLVLLGGKEGGQQQSGYDDAGPRRGESTRATDSARPGPAPATLAEELDDDIPF